MVTPEIVAPLDAHQKVTLPGQNMDYPGDLELYMLGLLEGSAGEQGAEVAYAAGEQEEAGLPSEPDELSVHGPWGHAR
jgi:Flp pilus assembly secretin CpaC